MNEFWRQMLVSLVWWAFAWLCWLSWPFVFRRDIPDWQQLVRVIVAGVFLAIIKMALVAMR